MTIIVKYKVFFFFFVKIVMYVFYIQNIYSYINLFLKTIHFYSLIGAKIWLYFYNLISTKQY